MIEAMTRYNILLHKRDVGGFLERLQKKAIMDIELLSVKENSSSMAEMAALDALEALLGRIEKLEAAFEAAGFGGLSRAEAAGGEAVGEVCELGGAVAEPRREACSKDVSTEIISKASQTIDLYLQKEEEYKKLLVQKEKDSIWGDFNWEVLRSLQNKLEILFCSTSEKNYKKLLGSDLNAESGVCGIEHTLHLEPIASENSKVYFVAIAPKGSGIEKTLSGAEICQPTRSPKEWSGILAEKTTELEALKTEISKIIASKAHLEEQKKALQSKILYNLAQNKLETSSQGNLKLVEGWVPSTEAENFDEFLSQEDCYFYKTLENQMPREEFLQKPIMLKNNAFARLFEPITKLFALPIASELDLTPFFAPFFMMFFGFCMGDAGYGLIFILASILLRKKVSEQFRPFLSLACLFGVATLVFGTISGTLFGYSILKIEALKEPLSHIVLSQNNLMVLSLVLGVVQIVFGMFVKVANQIKAYGLKYGIGSLGWALVVLSLIFILLPQFELFAMPSIVQNVAYVVFLLGAAMALFYNSPGKPIWTNLGLGLWNTYNTATGLLGDMLSYIRLFALGLTGGILGGAFNDLAFQMSPNIPVVQQVVIVLILLFGHSLNIALACLGAVVHPLRLTFVEFYKNSGFIGGGREYNAFKEIK